MDATEQLEALKMRVGAQPGQVVLFVDLSAVEQPSEVLKRLTAMGYEPQLRYLELQTGLHVVAVLKDEQHDPTQPLDEAYLLDEWEALGEQIHQEAVRLWRGYPRPIAA
ncbi:hypothetical protein K9N68_38455 (plasmid) [Kovacikia minuta CCNUW1]|uniref:hypothetical protein n=1 Tax=Kovacikia minuta TaxID=2931930 RepID=UPI001CCEE319|nr:hypothetical protein [Kovacikia minuta]UBF30072.1 hypothetical protein K9N68_38455 [Kovacikia minuta CCNUW1]